MLEKPQTKRHPYASAMALVGEIGLEIAIPAVIFSQLGKYADVSNGTYPRWTVVGLILAFIVSGYLIWKRAKAFREMYEKSDE